MSGKATATKSLKEKCSSRVQSTRENGENEIGGSSTVTSGGRQLQIGVSCSLVAAESPLPSAHCHSKPCAVAHAPPAMVFFFLFLFLPLLFAFLLTAVAVLFKPGCAVSAADTSSV